jgi:hypothetical protein
LSIRLEPSERSPLKPYLLLDPEDDKGVDPEFLGEAVKRFEEDESIKPAFIAAVEEMSRDLAAMTINDDYKSYLTVYFTSSRFPFTIPVADLSRLYETWWVIRSLPLLLRSRLSSTSLVIQHCLRRRRFWVPGSACHLSRAMLP